MAYTGKSLADGTVGSLATIYAVPSGKRVIVRSFSVYNTGASSETVKVYITRYGSSARQIAIAVLAQDESKMIVGDSEKVTLSSEDSIQAETTSSVDFVITGAEE